MSDIACPICGEAYPLIECDNEEDKVHMRAAHLVQKHSDAVASSSKVSNFGPYKVADRRCRGCGLQGTYGMVREHLLSLSDEDGKRHAVAAMITEGT